MPDKSVLKEPWNLTDLINEVKRDLLTYHTDSDDPAPLFVIDEITVEINFVVDGTIKGGVSFLKVVEVGSEIAEQRVQKVIVKLTPLVSKEKMLQELSSKQPEVFEKLATTGAKVFLRGVQEDNATPQR